MRGQMHLATPVAERARQRKNNCEVHQDAIAFYDECDGKLPSDYMWYSQLPKYAKCTEFMVMALKAYARKASGLLSEKAVTELLTKELRLVRAECSSEKPFCSQVVLAYVYRSLWGAAAKV